jgi:hypothetical protein
MDNLKAVSVRMTLPAMLKVLPIIREMGFTLHVGTR